ncbi:MAG: hypothetical protein OZSIB_0716 [Candidatus Ozemobacter sibiricus]|jgi:hypothetical protein|uniref:FG-GAP repeat protein n=1 Tax=Candidatus Ozemobacter sibiricus TaxID=2268124 RepID=A0A367ZW51_9BACT|nr:MAG: hypothetical protein OZSIB_0716 [Candidatus Ozemobacter sibiricus]
MKTSVIIICFVLSWNLLLPWATAAGATEPTVLASQTGLLMGPAQGVCEVRKLKDDQGITIAVYAKNGNPLWKSEPLGEDDKTFLLGETPTTLALQDLDRDGLPEILVAAFIGPRSSGLYVFRYDASTKGFVAIPCRFPKEGLDRDCLISDVHQASGGDLVMRTDGTAQVLGMIYSENPDEPPTPGLWTFAFQGGAFVHQTTEKLPPPGD